MKPLNKKERTKAFWRFTALFIVSILPICLTFYLFGKVSHVENTFLREQYSLLKENLSEEQGEERMYNNIIDASRDLSTRMNDISGSALTTNSSPRIESSISNFETSLSGLNNTVINGLSSQTEASLLEVSRNMVNSLRRLNDGYYSRTWEELKDAKDDLEECEEDKDDLKDELKGYK